MPHLTLEDMARLVDEAPSSIEKSHLDACAACRTELRALREQTAELSTLPPLDPPEQAWDAIEERLRAEGLLRAAPPFWRAAPRLLTLAASLALFLAGGLAGYAFGSDAGNQGVPTLAGAPALAPAGVEQAAEAVLAAETRYLDALQAYNRHTSGGAESRDMVARLAALESIVQLTRSALSEAPADPVINGYHFVALAQRDAMLQQIAASNETTWF